MSDRHDPKARRQIDRDDHRQVSALFVKIDKEVAQEIQHRAQSQDKLLAEVVEDAIRATTFPLRIWRTACPAGDWWAYVLAPSPGSAIQTLVHQHYQTEDTVEGLEVSPVSAEEASRVLVDGGPGSLFDLWYEALTSGIAPFVSVSSEDLPPNA